MPKFREPSLDVLRGLVMVLMVIDHTQEYQAGPGRGLVTDPMNLAVTPGLVYFWRILAHFCAPVFTFLLGISAALSGASAGKLARRGLLLLVLEATVINWAWTFNPWWPRYFFQIIAALGCALLALAAVRSLPRQWVLALGVLLVAGHNLLDGIRFAPHTWQHYVWSLLHVKEVLPLGGGFEFRTTYPVLPVIGLACCGYGLADWWRRPGAPLLLTGSGLIALFVVLRVTGIYGDPHPWESQPYGLQSFFNVTKYPLSFQFCLMTIGPALILLHFLRGRRQPQLEQLGRTAFFFYFSHLVLLHAAALLAAWILGLPVDLSARFGGVPDGIGFPVWATAPLALLATAVLYPLCRWYEPRRLPLL